MIRDEGVSGTKPLGQRPGGKWIASLLEARTTNVDAVVCVRLDRLGRDAAEQMALLKKFSSGRVALVAIAEQIDLSTSIGRAMAGMGAVWNELERARIAERTADALAHLRRKGRPWNHPPFGWQVVDGALVADPEEQKTLARARHLRNKGLSYNKVAERLESEKRPTKNGGQWYAMSVRSVLATAEKMAAAR